MKELVLSPDQERAVLSDATAIVVVAGAGGGKTEVVAHRIERLLLDSEDDAYRVVAVSYTVKASDELRARLADRLGDLHRRVDTDTIHGFALSLLRQHGTRIGLPVEPEILSRNEDRAELLGSWLTQSGRSVPEDPSLMLAQFDLARARCQDVPLLADWREALRLNGAVDYAAMLERAVELVEGAWMSQHLKRIYQHVVVDEAQNLTPAQYRFLTLVIGDPSAEHLHAVLVGDERQSIVDFAGADRTLIARFADEYGAERIELNTNYRSARTIIDVGRVVADALGQPTSGSESVEFPAEGSVALQECSTEEAEGKFVSDWIAALLSDGLDVAVVAPGEATTVQLEQIAVLARSAASLRSVRDALTVRNIESASSSTEDDWVASSAAKAVIEMIEYRSAPDHIASRRRLAKLAGKAGADWEEPESLLQSSTDPSVVALARLTDAKDAEALLEATEDLEIDDPDWPDDLGQLNLAWRSFVDRTDTVERTFGNFRQHIARCQRGDSLDPGVRLLTVHKAQGREFKAVAVIGCNEGQFPDFRAKTSAEKAAELRTLYVAISRPARALLLTRAKQRQTRFGLRVTDPSSFLAIVAKAISR